jgi:hypothetical protein
MANFNSITFDEIYTKIMIVLVANESKMMDQYSLYSKVIDKFNPTTLSIHTDFKYRFMIVLRGLMSRNDDVKVSKKNNVYYVIYNAPNDLNTIQVSLNYEPSWINDNTFTNYILNNNLETEIKYIDPESGNTIYHDVLSTSNYSDVKKLLATYPTSLDCVNYYDKTPIECIKDIQIAVVIINELNKKINKLERDLNNAAKSIIVLENRDYVEECSVKDFIKIKINKMIKDKFEIFFIICLSILFGLLIQLLISLTY